MPGSVRAAFKSGMLALSCLLGLAVVPAASAAAATDRPNSFTAARSVAASPQGQWLSETIGTAADEDWYKFTLTSTRYTLITLGKLPADYVLSLYDGSGRLVATSARRGREYEELYRQLAAGTYYVRVDSTSGYSATSAYTLRFRALSESVQVLSSRRVTNEYGVRVYGEVVNNTSSWRGFTKVTASFYNSSGAFIGSEYGYADRVYLAPRTRSGFLVLDTSPPPGVASYRLSVSSDNTTSRPKTGLTLAPATPYNDNIGYTYYPGRITNTTASAIAYPYVHVTRYDSSGNVYDNDWTILESVPARGTAPWEVLMTRASVNRVAYSWYAD